MLVAAVLAPHRAEHAELDQRRLATQTTDDQLVLGGEEAKGAKTVLGGSLVARDAHVSAGARSAMASDSNMTRPSVLPSSASEARTRTHSCPRRARSAVAAPGPACRHS